MSNYEKVIVLRSVYGKANQIVFLQPAKNPKTGLYPSHIRAVNSHGDLILSETDKELGYDEKSGFLFFREDDIVDIPDGKTFNTNDPKENSEWEAIKHSKLIANDRYAKEADGSYIIDGSKKSDGSNKSYGIAELYIEHAGKDSEKKATKRELIHRANTFIYDDSIEKRRNMCKILNKNPERISDPDVTNYLTEQAERDPQRIIDLYTGGDTHIRLLFVDAREKGIIKVKDRLYIYGNDIILGSTDESVIMYLKNPRNKKIVDMIKRELDPDFYTDIIEYDEDLTSTENPVLIPDEGKKVQERKVTTKK